MPTHLFDIMQQWWIIILVLEPHTNEGSLLLCMCPTMLAFGYSCVTMQECHMNSILNPVNVQSTEPISTILIPDDIRTTTLSGIEPNNPDTTVVREVLTSSPCKCDLVAACSL